MKTAASQTTRIRDKQFSVRVSADEFALISGKYKKSKRKTLTDFLLDCVRDVTIIAVDPQSSADILLGINRVGNNINQIAYKLNSGQNINAGAFSEICSDYKIVRNAMVSLTKGVVYNADPQN